jgi:hypothetical protein
MKARALAAVLIALLCGAWEPVKPWPIEDTYTARTIVTGKDERNRPAGFRMCFADVLVRASGDYRLAGDKRVPKLAVHAADYITSFSYRDRLEGKPLGDEQGTYDRPHYLTCKFDPTKIDVILKKLGRKPWTGRHPHLVLVVAVHGRKASGMLTGDGPLDPDMRESLDAAAIRYGMTVELPSVAALQKENITLDTVPKASAAALKNVAASSKADLAVRGDLTFKESALGWIATWDFEAGGKRVHWSVRGVNYDAAFRNAVEGVMLALSGNGEPE